MAQAHSTSSNKPRKPKSDLPQLPPPDYLVFDCTNMMYRSFYSNKTEQADVVAGLACHELLQMLNKYFRMYPPKQHIVLAMDRHSWRKDFMADGNRVSKKVYKGTRRQDMTPSEQVKYQQFLGYLADIEKFISERTSIACVARAGLEADDIIAGLVRYAASRNETTILISTDGDMTQLLKYPGVIQITPNTDTVVTLAEAHDDPLYYTFLKCIRGDISDNIQSAYPRVRETAVFKAYNDAFDKANLMNATWTDADGTVYRVGDLFEENRILIDFDYQPDNIKQLLEEVVPCALNNCSVTSLFHIQKFLGKYGLKTIADHLDQYLPMLTHHPKQ